MKIEIKSNEVPVTKASPDADGVWRAKPTGQMKTEYTVVVDGETLMSTPDLRQAKEKADGIAFMNGLVSGDPSASEGLAIYLTKGGN